MSKISTRYGLAFKEFIISVSRQDVFTKTSDTRKVYNLSITTAINISHRIPEKNKITGS